MNAADGCTRILIGRCGDGAGIQDDDFRLDGRGGAFQSAGEQLALDSGAIGLGRAASEVLDMIGRHQAIILGVLCGWRWSGVAATGEGGEWWKPSHNTGGGISKYAGDQERV